MPFIDLDQADGYETSALPGQGDVNAGGGGITTSSLVNENDLEAYGLDTQSKAARASRGNGHIQGYTQGGGYGKVADGKGNIYDATTGEKTGKAVTPQLSQNPQANHPLWTVGIIIAILFLWKFSARPDHEGDKLVKFSLLNTARITLMAGLGILILKWVFGVYSIASISPTIEFL
jgi:hypothetical protein